MNTFFSKSKHKQVSIDKEFGICDDPPPAKNPAYLDKADKTKWIATVENNQANSINFMAIDNCKEFEFPKKGGNTGEIGKRCDCVLSIDSKIIFVELKQRRHRGWIAQADEQLRSTINFFNQHSDTKKYFTKQAYIANSLRPITKTNQQSRINTFFNDTGYVLRIQNRIEIT